MAWSINKAFILGNVTKDPEMRYTPNGQGVTSFGVATNRRWKDAGGAIQEETQFHEVVAWGKLAETITQILRKGVKVAVIGRIQTRNWDAPDGSKRSRTEIIMEDFVPLTPKSGGGEDFELTQTAEAPTEHVPIAPTKSAKTESKDSKPGSNAPSAGGDDEINLDDIPF